MKKRFLTIASALFLLTVLSQLKAQSDKPDTFLSTETYYWLRENPASAERAQVLLDAEAKQIYTTGSFDVYPFEAPKLHQLPPSLQHLQYFYEGQKLLTEQQARKKKDFTALRAHYQQLYDMHDPAYRNEAEYYLGYIDYAEGKYESALHHFEALPAEDKYAETIPFYRMQIYFAQGKWDEASNQCRKLLLSDTLTEEQEAEVSRIQAECQLMEGQTDKALTSYRNYLRSTQEPEPASAYNAAVLELQQGNYAEALSAASQATVSNDKRLRQRAYMVVGQTLYLKGEKQQAQMAFSQVAQMTDADLELCEAAAYNNCAILHDANSPWGDEVVQLENFLNTYPTSKYAEQVSQYLSEVYSTTKNYDQALASIAKIKSPTTTLVVAKQRLLYQSGTQHYVNAAYGQAIKQFSNCIAIGNVNKEAYTNAYFWRGESHYHLKQYNEAVTDYQAFIDNTKDADKTANAWYCKGYAQMKQQNYTGAITSFTKFVSLPADRNSETGYDGMLRLADCNYYTRQFQNAEGYYHTVAQTESHQADYAAYQEAIMMGIQKKYDAKQQVLSSLIEKHPTSQFVDDAWFEKGRTALLQNNNLAAIQNFQQVLNHHADSPIAPQAAIQLAMTYNNVGQTDEAARIYQLVKDKYPDTDAAATAAEDMYLLNIQRQTASLPALYATDQYAEVIETYKKLQIESIDFREIQKMQLLTGKSYLAMGQPAEARTLFEKAAADMRTAAGAEAKFMIAQTQYDAAETDAALSTLMELVQSGTPHQYWVAKGLIMMADIYNYQGDTFTATEYLKNLQQNYAGQDDDIQQLIQARLEAWQQVES